MKKKNESKYHVEIFHNETYSDDAMGIETLEEEINDFIKKHPELEIRSVNQSQSYAENRQATILFITVVFTKAPILTM